jgi:hypothetical protein
MDRLLYCFVGNSDVVNAGIEWISSLNQVRTQCRVETSTSKLYLVPHLYSDVFVRFVTSRQLSDNPSL